MACLRGFTASCLAIAIGEYEMKMTRYALSLIAAAALVGCGSTVKLDEPAPVETPCGQESRSGCTQRQHQPHARVARGHRRPGCAADRRCGEPARRLLRLRQLCG